VASMARDIITDEAQVIRRRDVGKSAGRELFDSVVGRCMLTPG